MTEKLKKANKYVTFIPTNEEFILGWGSVYRLTSPDKKYLKYGFESTINKSTGNTVFRLYLNTVENVEKVTNAYDLHYEAVYKGERFGVLIDPDDPIVTLFISASDAIPRALDFKLVNKGEWEKDVHISEVEIIPVKTPIDLSRYLPKN